MLKQAKQLTNLKQTPLAKFLGVSEPTLHNWESGNKHGKTWPLWALEKCGFTVASIKQIMEAIENKVVK